MLLRLSLILSCLFFAILPAEAKRVALVVGNSNYKSFNVLPNPVNDARLMEKALRESGFEVTLILDADQAQMKRAILDFGRTLRKGVDASMFFYAGHGVQVKGENYLIPIDADLQSEDEVGVQTIDVNAFLETMESAKSPFNIIVLDACRNNPLSAHRGGGGGLAPVTAPKGSFVAYSTAPGKVALDGDGIADSPYSLALAQTLVVPGMKLEDVFKKTRELVLASTSGEQLPFESTSITGDFYFRDALTEEQPVLVTPVVPSIDPLASDFDLARSLNSTAGWDLFLTRHGTANDMRVDVAKQERDKLALSDKAVPVLDQVQKNDVSAVTTCDLLTAADNDAVTGRKRIEFDAIKSNEAIPSCREAVAKDPHELRLVFQLGRALDKGKQFYEAIKLYRKAAEGGNLLGMNNLGAMYFDGLGVKQDKIEAAKWYRKAAEGGNFQSMNNLGAMYDNGHGVKQDKTEAVKWYRKAAEGGNLDGMVNLGFMLENGTGVNLSFAEALNWYRRAANAGNTLGMTDLGHMYDNGYGVKTDKVEAANWYRKAAQGGDALGMNNLGFLYEKGEGVTQDNTEAANLYRKSAEAGEVYGMRNFANMLRTGRGVAKNISEADVWEQKANAVNGQ
jgi:uncharacterized protein